MIYRSASDFVPKYMKYPKTIKGKIMKYILFSWSSKSVFNRFLMQ